MSPAAASRAVVLTPSGTGAIAVIRVEGADSLDIVEKFFRPRSRVPLSESTCDRLRYGTFLDGNETIDDVLISRTCVGDVPAVDISMHGGLRIVERILQALERAGAAPLEEPVRLDRLWPIANRIELDAMHALWRAKTHRAVRFLAWQRRHLPDHLERVASWCHSDPERAHEAVSALLESAATGCALVDGATVSIVGPPNSGKSTLFNYLVGRAATVVSARAGTTRDWVAQSIEMNGVPLTFVDTAGQHEALDVVERQAMEGARAAGERADLRLLVLDGSTPLAADARSMLEARRGWRRCLTVFNKIDKGLVLDATAILGCGGDSTKPVGQVSAATGAGIDELVADVLRVLGVDKDVDASPALFCTRQVRVVADVAVDLPGTPAVAARKIRAELDGTGVDSA